jgi:Ca2+-binding RTX toxin-like protein
MRSCVCVIVAVLAAVVAEASQAATVRVTGGSNAVRYVAGPGESNDLTLTDIEDSWPTAYMVSDPGATITPGTGCVAVDAHTAVCIAESGSMSNVRVALGDGDDVLHPQDAYTRADGGTGNDRLFGGSADDRLQGGAGTDEIRGGDGADVLVDGDPDATPGADILDGGPGSDWVSYETRALPVRVDLSDPGADGAAGEQDVLLGIENVHGGHGDDVLVGDDGGNQFNDEGGTNLMVGNAGVDHFRGARAGRVDCGSDDDLVRNVTRRAQLDRSCETIYRASGDDDFRVRVRPQPAPGGMTLVMWCSGVDGELFDCSGTVMISSRAGTLARGRIPDGTGRQVARLVLTPLGKRLLKRREIAATIHLDGSGMPELRWGITLGPRDARLSA